MGQGSVGSDQADQADDLRGQSAPGRRRSLLAVQAGWMDQGSEGNGDWAHRLVLCSNTPPALRVGSADLTTKDTLNTQQLALNTYI